MSVDDTQHLPLPDECKRNPCKTTQLSTRAFEIFTVDGLFDANQMRLLNDAFLNPSPRPFNTLTGFYNGKEALPEHAAMIWEAIRPILPQEYVDAGGRRWQIIGPSWACMYARVEEGQQFGMHTDTGCEFDEEGRTCSKFTVLIYLNDDFAGGTTEFFALAGTGANVTVQPAAGRLLAFDIDVFHRGNRVTQGSKRWFGCELVCRRVM